MVDGNRAELDLRPGPKRLQKGVEGNHNKVVPRLAKDGAALLRHANDLEGNLIHHDGFADWIAISKKLLAQIVPDAGYVHVPFVFKAREEPAISNLNIGKSGQIWCAAH